METLHFASQEYAEHVFSEDNDEPLSVPSDLTFSGSDYDEEIFREKGQDPVQ